MSDPEFETAARIAPRTAEQLDAWIERRAELMREILPDGPLPESVAEALQEQCAQQARAVLADPDNQLPETVLDVLCRDETTGKIITGARYMCAATTPDLLPGLDAAVIERETHDGLREFAGDMVDALRDNLLATFILSLDPK